MRFTLLACLLAATPALAASHASRHAPPHRAPAASPRSIGQFGDWQAATHQEGGRTVCYAFTRASASSPALPGRGQAVLTVTERPGSRDAVAISPGFAYPDGADVQVQAEGAALPFYTAERSAYARDGRAAVEAFARARQAIARSPAPRGATVSDTFSLRGFGPAYAAVTKACPAGRS